jgi:hypothetical protein
MITHETGRLVEVKVTAGAKGGSSLVGRWLAGVVFDEFTLLSGSKDGVVNLDDSRRQVEGRLLGQEVMVGSPHAPMGPGYDIVMDNFGVRQSEDLVVAWGVGPDLNPAWYTPERIKAFTPDIFAVTCTRQFLSPESQYLSGLVDKNIRKENNRIPRMPNQHYVAAMDASSKTNAWTLIVLTQGSECEGGPLLWQVVLHHQWLPYGTPLVSSEVLSEIKELIEPYGLDQVYSDQWSFQALLELAGQQGLRLVEHNMTHAETAHNMKMLRQLLEDVKLSLPNDPYMRRDLLGVKRRPTYQGIKFDLQTTRDGRHSDYVPPLVLLMGHLPPAPDKPTIEATGELYDFNKAKAMTEDTEWLSKIAKRMLQ